MRLTKLQQETLDLFNSGMGVTQIADKLGVNHGLISRRLKEIKVKASREGADLGFHVIGKSIYGELEQTDGSYKMGWVKTKKDVDDIEETASAIVESLNSQIHRKKKTPKPKIAKNHTGYMESVIFGDPHLNMRAWHREVGASWNLKIAIKRHTEGMLDLIENSLPAHTGRLISLGDLLHADSLRPVTLNQTAVDVDGRMSMAIDDIVEFLRHCIDLMLEKYIHVDVVLARGNHSPTIELLISKMLRIAYEKEPRITVVDNTAQHIPLPFEKNFQLITHGQGLSHQKKADIATSIYKDLHGAASFTHVLSGHLHHHDSKTLSGVRSEIFEILPTMDSWHFESGFVTSDQSCCIIRYHPKGGIQDQHYYNPRFYIGEK